MPQPAIAQPGSCASTSRNALSPSLHQTECSSATARCSFGCTAAEQELANDTLPSFSAGSAATADVARTDKATAKTVRAAGCDMAAFLPDWWPVAHGMFVGLLL